jgi:hypothetical protein
MLLATQAYRVSAELNKKRTARLENTLGAPPFMYLKDPQLFSARACFLDLAICELGPPAICFA